MQPPHCLPQPRPPWGAASGVHTCTPPQLLSRQRRGQSCLQQRARWDACRCGMRVQSAATADRPCPCSTKRSVPAPGCGPWAAASAGAWRPSRRRRRCQASACSQRAAQGGALPGRRWRPALPVMQGRQGRGGCCPLGAGCCSLGAGCCPLGAGWRQGGRTRLEEVGADALGVHVGLLEDHAARTVVVVGGGGEVGGCRFPRGSRGMGLCLPGATVNERRRAQSCNNLGTVPHASACCGLPAKLPRGAGPRRAPPRSMLLPPTLPPRAAATHRRSF